MATVSRPKSRQPRSRNPAPFADRQLGVRITRPDGSSRVVEMPDPRTTFIETYLEMIPDAKCELIDRAGDIARLVFIVMRPKDWNPTKPTDVPPMDRISIDKVITRPNAEIAAMFIAEFNALELGDRSGVWAVSGSAMMPVE